ncbi:DNA repair exonuclease, partial [Bacillus altitudinis]
EPCIIYPGNIQGRHRKETGEKGSYLIELTKQGTHCSFFHTADVVWDEIEVNIDGLETVDELMTSASSAMNECRREEEGTL